MKAARSRFRAVPAAYASRQWALPGRERCRRMSECVRESLSSAGAWLPDWRAPLAPLQCVVR